MIQRYGIERAVAVANPHQYGDKSCAPTPAPIHTPTLRYRCSALIKAWSAAWPAPGSLKKKWRILRRNSLIALEHPHLFDDDLQRQRLNRLADIVRDKTVAVVGNAQYLLETNAGSEIEQHQVIVRFNNGFVVAPSSQGTRTEVHCLASNVAAGELARHCPEALLVYVTPVRFHLNSAFRSQVAECICIPLADWRLLVKALGNQRPSAGLIIVDYLLHRSAATKVSIYGFDWKRTKTFYHKSKNRDWHSWEAERRLFLLWATEHGSRLNIGHCPMGPLG